MSDISFCTVKVPDMPSSERKAIKLVMKETLKEVLLCLGDDLILLPIEKQNEAFRDVRKFRLDLQIHFLPLFENQLPVGFDRF